MERFLKLFLLFNLNFLQVISFECLLYLAPSLFLKSGYGIIAGKNISKDTKIISDKSILIDHLLLEDYQISNYVYRAKLSHFSAGSFGPILMLNHLKEPNLKRTWADDLAEIYSVPIRPYTTYSNIECNTNVDVKVGEELFTTYGVEDWFTDRDIPYDPSAKPSQSYTIEELEKVGHCITNVVVNNSNIPLAGSGVFANRNFSKGELVTVSPMLATPLHQIQKEGTTSLLLNYLMTHVATDLAFLPIGYSGLLNHGGKSSNLVYEWYDTKQPNRWASKSVEEKIERRDKIFEPFNITSLVYSLTTDLYLGYYATRDIQEGEELTIDYGLGWESSYLDYLDTLETWLSIYEKKMFSFDIITAPQFRHSIQVFDWDFIPRKLYKSCIGHDCHGNNRHVTKHKILHNILNKQKPSNHLNSKAVKQSKLQFKSIQSNSNSDSQTCSNENNWSGKLVNKVRNILGLSCR